MAINLGRLLLKENLVTPQQLEKAISHQNANGSKLDNAVATLGYVKEQEIRALLSRQYGVPSIDLAHFEVDPSIIRIIPPETARKYQVLPLSRSERTLTLAMADPANVFAMDDVAFITGYAVEPVVASESSVEAAIEKYYGSARSLEFRREAGGGGAHGGGSSGMGLPMLARNSPSLKDVMDGPTLTVDDMASNGLSKVDLDAMSDSAEETARAEDDTHLDVLSQTSDPEKRAAMHFTSGLIVEALKRRASDIHIEPYENELRVRVRADGVLHNLMAVPAKLREPVTTWIKTMARLTIADKQVVERGRFSLRLRVKDRSREVAGRVSNCPTRWGETMILRLFDPSQLLLDRNNQGFEAEPLERLNRAVGFPNGMLLVTGPSRSGKTTTLYSAVASLNSPHVNIMTAEETVDFRLPGINQVQIRESIGLGHAACLRSLLRQDPDVIVIEEIRDGEAARLAVKAALAGHSVLATMSGSDGSAAVESLMEMGVRPSALGKALNLVLTQRLVRRICTECKTEVADEGALASLASLGVDLESARAIPVYRGRGCEACYGSGYKGRIGLYEAMPISEALRETIGSKATAAAIRAQAVKEGMTTLRMSGIEKIKQGITTVEEVSRETE